MGVQRREGGAAKSSEPKSEAENGVNSKALKILPLSRFFPRFWQETPAKTMIPIDQVGGGGYPPITNQ